MNLKAIKRSVLLSVLLAQSICLAQETDIATCLSTAPDALRVEYGGKTYLLRNQECKTLFEADPERYSQLFDALLEENAKGSAKPQTPQPKASESASLVPS
jgi:YHS domain-containing protein